MPALGPRETDPDAWISWLKEALGLLRRRPLAWLCWLAVCLCLLYVGHRASWAPLRTASLFFLMPMSLVVFIRLAWCADYSRPARLTDLLPTNRDCGLAIGIGAGLFAVLTAFSAMLAPLADGLEHVLTALGLYREVLDDGLPAPPALRHTMLGPVLVAGVLLGAAVFACLALLLAFGQWFAIPMLVLHQTPLPPSMAVSIRAYMLNPVPMVGLAGVVMISVGLVALSMGWIALAMMPFYGALLYTSYRDVFLGREESEPAAVVEDETHGVPLGH
ncbi:MAG: hypothetical protein WED00_00495 [Aquisalimonadaceae bacterium]